jgi:hypothetical protein
LDELVVMLLPHRKATHTFAPREEGHINHFHLLDISSRFKTLSPCGGRTRREATMLLKFRFMFLVALPSKFQNFSKYTIFDYIMSFSDRYCNPNS